jgi:hypothetical protein
MTYSVHGLPQQDLASLFALGAADLVKTRALLADPQIAYIHAHDVAHGCFSARIART